MTHEDFIRETYALAISAGKKGNATFGAVLVHDGEIIMRAENTTVTDNDEQCHAERNLAVEAKKTLSQDILSHSTIYSSAYPCPMCTGAILEAGIPRIVYGVGHASFAQLIPKEVVIPSTEETVRAAGTATEVIGPFLEDDGMLVFQYWGGEFRPLEQLLAEYQ